MSIPTAPDAPRLRVVHATTVPLSLRLFLAVHLRFLRDRGCRVFAVAAPGEDWPQVPSGDGIEQIQIPMARRMAPLADGVSLLRLIALFNRLKPDIVHAHTPKAGFLCMIAAYFARVPLQIYHIHGFPFMTTRGAKRRLLVATEWLACRLADQVYSVSESIRQVAIAEGICPAEHVQVIHHGTISGIDADGRYAPSRISAAERERLRMELRLPGPVVGFVGRLTRDKGIPELVAAWRTVREDFPDATLLIIGPAEKDDALSDECFAALRNDPRIRLTGAVADTAPYYAVMDFLVLPSRREGFGLSVMEAAAMEIPAVASNIPGISDAVVPDHTGLLVPLDDVPALARAISVYLRDPALCRRHGTQARERILRDFNQTDVLAATFEAYRRLWSTSSAL